MFRGWAAEAAPKSPEEEPEAPLSYGVFTIEEFDTMIAAAITTFEPGSEAESEILYKYFQWMTDARIRAVIHDEILKGEVLVRIAPDGEPFYAGKRRRP